MKKRVKLFTTIASLCLAVALMAFGVYAAQTATFTVGSTVNFSADGRLAGELKVVAYANATSAEDELKTASETIKGTAAVTSNTQTGTLTVPAVTISPDTRWVVYVVTFTKSTTSESEDATVAISAVKQGQEGSQTTLAEKPTEGAAPTWYISATTTETNKAVFAVYYGGDATLTNEPITFTVQLECGD